MSRTSSKESLSRGEHRAWARYHRGLWLVAVCAIAIAALALLSYALQGPRLRSANLDIIRSIAQPDSTVRLESDRPLASIDPSAVTIIPEVPFSVGVQGPLVTIVFEGALRYDTDYRIQVSGVRGEDSSATAQWLHEFRTPSAQLRYLDRGDAGEPDRIMSVGIDQQPPQEIYRAESIDAFVPVGSAVLVVRHQEGEAVIELVEVVSGLVERLVIPEDTVVESVVPRAIGTKIVFTLSSIAENGEYDRTLFVADTAGQRSASSVKGLDGAELRATKAAAVPGAEKVVVWVDDVDVVQVDLLTGLALPVVTQAQEYWSVSSDGDQIVVVDVGGTVAVDIDTLEEVRFPAAELGGRPVFEGQTHVMATGVRLQTVAVATNQGTDFVSLVVQDDGQGSLKPLYRTPGDVGSIGRFVVSPGDQYVAIEVIPDRSQVRADGRLLEPRAESITTVVVEVESGSVVRSVEGFWPVW